MRVSAIRKARTKAQAFIEAVKALGPSLNKDENRYVDGSKASGAVRRASMDLTRALAEMRKP